jgi:hypothetical protein
MIYNFYVYDRKGNCIYYEEWNRKIPTKNLEEEQKLMYGMLWSLKSFVKKTSPSPYGFVFIYFVLICISDTDTSGFHFYKTNAYKLHFYETPTNIKFIVTSDPEVGDLRDALRNIYKNVFVEYVVKNPLYKLTEPVKCELFVENLNKEIKNLPAFKSPSKSGF